MSVPGIESGKVDPPTRKKNKDLQPREYLTGPEIELLMKTARITKFLPDFNHGQGIEFAVRQ